MPIITEAISKSLNKFAEGAKIKDKQYGVLRKRRDTIIDLIQEYSENQHLKISKQFNIGSYKIKTGVKRYGKHGWAFDIDYVLVYEQEFEYENFKNNLTNWLRDKVKEKYKYNVIVRNKKKVVSIAFRDKDNEKTIFYLDVALYLETYQGIKHIARDENGKYNLTLGNPKKTHERQRDALAQNSDKRNSIILLKYLQEKGRILGASSIFITDFIIGMSNDLDTFSLTKKFIQYNMNATTFKLEELPNSELIEEYADLNKSLYDMNNKFFSCSTTIEVFQAMNSWFDNELEELDKEISEERNERYSGG